MSRLSSARFTARVNALAFQRNLKNPLADEPEGLWDELTDPLQFVVGSMLLMFYKPPTAGMSARSSDTPEVRRLTLFHRLGATAFLAAVVALPIVTPTIWPHLGTGDGFVYAATLFGAGIITLIPGRLAELRSKSPLRVRGIGYPRQLRKVLLAVEYVVTVAALVTIIVWGFGGASESP